MDCLIVCNFKFPWNRGIDRTVQAFKTLGFNVSVLAHSTLSDEREKYNAANIVIMESVVRGSILKRMLSYRLGLNPVWLVSIFLTIKRVKPVFVLVREIHLVPYVWVVAKIFNTPVLLDMREALPYAVMVYGKSNLSHYITRNSYIVKMYEKLSLYLSDHIYVVCRSQVDRLTKYRKKVSVVHNSVTAQYCDTALDVYYKKYKSFGSDNLYANRNHIVFFGELSKYRHIEIVLEAVVEARRRGIEMKLTIFGEGEKEYVQALKNISMGKESISLNKYIDHKDIPCEMAKYGFGLIPYPLSQHVAHTVAGKYYEYIATGLPIISTRIPDIVEDINKYQHGFLFDSSSKFIDQISLLKVFSVINEITKEQYLELIVRSNKCFVEQYLPKNTVKEYKYGIDRMAKNEKNLTSRRVD